MSELYSMNLDDGRPDAEQPTTIHISGARNVAAYKRLLGLLGVSYEEAPPSQPGMLQWGEGIRFDMAVAAEKLADALEALKP